MSAKALENEINEKNAVVFGSGEDAVTLVVPAKWKRFKFLRALNAGDIIGALEAAFTAEQVALLDDLDIDDDEFIGALENLAQVLGGTDSGN